MHYPTANVGAGIRLGTVYTVLDGYDTIWTRDICLTVGLAGLLGAGGFNIRMRALDLSRDRILSAPGSVRIYVFEPPALLSHKGQRGRRDHVRSRTRVVELELRLTQLPRLP